MSDLTSPRVASARRLCLLSNGTYSVMLSENGAGFSRWRDLAVTRWREDSTRDAWGSYLLLRDEQTGAAWSATRQPLDSGPLDTTVTFDEGRAEFVRREGSLTSTLQIAVDPDADIELRRLTLTNHGASSRRLSLTSYAELVVGPIEADNAHPAFSKMFVQTAGDGVRGVLLANRRQRAKGETGIWAAHALQTEGRPGERSFEHETDRARFLGRCRALPDAQAMQPGATLSNFTGTVLDPIFSLRQHVTLAPGCTVSLLLWTRLADTREGALALTAQLDDPNAAEQLFQNAARYACAERSRLGVDKAQSIRFDRWLGALLFSDPSQRAAGGLLARGHGGAQTLWAAGISGDRPIMLLRASSPVELPLLEAVLLAQADWRSKRLAVDVVILNTARSGAADTLHHAIVPLVSAQQLRFKADSAAVKTEVFLFRASAISEEVRDGLLTVARVLLGPNDPVDDVLGGEPMNVAAVAPLVASTPAQTVGTSAESLEFPNGHGGFSCAGRAYHVDLEEGRCTPAPWINVISNPDFGCLVSAEGGGYTWSVNSQQNPLTPWPNDPVSDSPHEVLYLRDEDSGSLWSATALPIRVAGAAYHTTHGKGYSRFSSNAHGIDLELTMCVAPTDSVKLSRLRLCNRSTSLRRLSVTAYVEWALGAIGSEPVPFVVTARDEQTGALLARNRWRSEFADRVAFADLCGLQQSISGDRKEFLGSLGNVSQPAALQIKSALSGRVGAGLDPCGALQTRIELSPNTQIDLVFLLGDAASEETAQALIVKYRADCFDQILVEVAAQWSGLLDTVQVRTPNRALDIMLNDWLLYQVLSCRVWARCAYYQTSGAYGFRDQLQDVMALCVSRPDLAREHILRAAGRQFIEGDVQHWWLPPGGQGIRTRISDDRIWLVYVAAHYVDVTGDAAVMDEFLPFLVGPPIPADATDSFALPGASPEIANLYEHCVRALDSGLTRGAHGLPLMGTGDWNDGMNSVGEQGRGESSWLGWFLVSTITSFLSHAERRGDMERAKRWREYATELRGALEFAWDGEWYRRGYYDDGAPLGAHQSEECRIDSIAQSWSVLPGATNLEHASQAMESVDRMLVDHEHQVARLFTPPFDLSPVYPGYIKGYPPGVRENGGQYSHGATWSIFAWARLGDGDRAGAMFDLINPINRSENAEAVARYKVEPYVANADVYSVTPHVGRGGWTWYTGTAGWLYRAGLEALLGFQLRGDRLLIDPCIPKNWPGFEITYRRRGRMHAVTRYEITVDNASRVGRGVTRVQLDGEDHSATGGVELMDDGKAHTLRITIGHTKDQ
ncbi:glycosyl transferase family 36 [Thermomonas sp.]|uniref:GH36-type glycosyl hydrolase domain-containing protein n=1 Tax=Thermomonas sp. TaxID=1971895 RepID=UPI002489CBAE|nr:glycosyl transferase family 36 [Thermomonas sp.]MDI1252506.1 glycosyl transferase family 36 [Thermomonas sp.]